MEQDSDPIENAFESLMQTLDRVQHETEVGKVDLLRAHLDNPNIEARVIGIALTSEQPKEVVLTVRLKQL